MWDGVPDGGLVPVSTPLDEATERAVQRAYDEAVICGEYKIQDLRDLARKVRVIELERIVKLLLDSRRLTAGTKAHLAAAIREGKS